MGNPSVALGGLTTPTMALHVIWSMRKCQLFCSLGKSNAIVFHRILEKTLYKGAARNPILRRDIQFRKEIKCESFDGACCIHRAMMPRASESLNFPAGRRWCMVDLVDVRSPWNQTCFSWIVGHQKNIYLLVLCFINISQGSPKQNAPCRHVPPGLVQFLHMDFNFGSLSQGFGHLAPAPTRRDFHLSLEKGGFFALSLASQIGSCWMFCVRCIVSVHIKGINRWYIINVI